MKKRLSGLLLTLALALTLLPISAYASDSISSFSLTHNPRESINFILEKNKLTVANLPDSAAYSSIWVNVVNLNGIVEVKQVINRSADGSASLSLSRLGDGKYYIEMYFFAGNGIYNSYIFGDELRFDWSDGNGTFEEAPTLINNKKTFAAGRSDAAILAHYLSPSNFIQSDNAEIVKLAEEITKGITDDYNKAYAIHEWVCVNIWYDWDATGKIGRLNWDAVSTLTARRTICEGYSNLMAALLRAAGIPAKTVNGHGRITAKTGAWTENQLSGNERNHVWNEAYIGGRWVIIDATWDSGNDYSGGAKTASGGLYFNRYFDPTIEAFSLDHFMGAYPESTITLSDAPSPWAVKQVDSAISYGFVPLAMRMEYSQSLTRAEFCALAVTLYETVKGKQINGRVKFGDTTDINIAKMAYLGIVNGVGSDKFAPDEPLEREQAAIIIARLAEALGCKLPKGELLFSDSDSVSPWAAEAVSQVQAAGIMGSVGNDMFSPKGGFTREQSIVALQRLYELIK